ncbi:radical SAM protein [Anaeromicropila populeti]|uniref:FeMo cofactor biosynthesis protein NifB n=1 Tax=Anaeromicropila populeti TaxID=37658 RepID=A0A1I6HSN9_9FIRM|nr:radical SAM protein [Anaeromicropila populeti]SFR57466.1 nitrogen fixation protein NifB [Anaeromicropila populeti]
MNEIVHPCFDDVESGYRFHLPIAPKCDTKCNFCKRQISGDQERPGVTSEILKINDIEHYINRNISLYPDCRIIGVAGPGDPMSNPTELFSTFKIVNEKFHQFKKCMCTNGFYLSKYKDEFIDAKLDYVTITLNSRNAETLGDIYEFLKYDGELYQGVEMGRLVMRLQDEALRIIDEIPDLKLKINIVVIPGVNDNELEDMIDYISQFNVYTVNLIPVLPVKGTAFEKVPSLSKEEIQSLKNELRGKYNSMKFKKHCSRCRADACGKICSK